jgi:hypothetical protein
MYTECIGPGYGREQIFFLPPAGNRIVEAQGRQCLAVVEALFFDHFLDNTKDLELLASAVGRALADSGIDSFKRMGVTEAALIVDLDFHVFMKGK